MQSLTNVSSIVGLKTLVASVTGLSLTNAWIYFSTEGDNPTTWADMETLGPAEATRASLES